VRDHFIKQELWILWRDNTKWEETLRVKTEARKYGRYTSLYLINKIIEAFLSYIKSTNLVFLPGFEFLAGQTQQEAITLIQRAFLFHQTIK
jgi:hypothetical protein